MRALEKRMNACKGPGADDVVRCSKSETSVTSGRI